MGLSLNTSARFLKNLLTENTDVRHKSERWIVMAVKHSGLLGQM